MLGRLQKVFGCVTRPHLLHHTQHSATSHCSPGGRIHLRLHRVLVGVASLDPLDPEPVRQRYYNHGDGDDSDRSQPKQVLFGAGVGTLALAGGEDSDNDNNNNQDDSNSDKTCQYCGQDFSTPESRKRHEDNLVCRKGKRKREDNGGPSGSDDGDGRLICCGKKYSSKMSLLNHQRYVSTLLFSLRNRPMYPYLDLDLSDTVLRSPLRFPLESENGIVCLIILLMHNK